MTGVYLSYLPRAFMRSIAGFPQRGNSYFLPRAQETPDETLCTRIWPDTDVWLERMEACHPDRADNEVVRLDLAGSGFLRLLRTLRVILLQDSVVLRQQFPLHPLWADPLFNCEEYRRFAARVESSLVNVVTPEELTMQKYWSTQETVAKLRHEAAIAEIKKATEIVRSISDRLDKIERSSASTPPAPVWVPGFWVEPAASGSRSIPVPPLLSGAVTSSSATQAAGVGNVHHVPPLPYAPPLATSYASRQANVSNSSSVQSSSLPPSPPIVLDPQAPPMEYKLFRGSNSVFQLWTEWVFGLAGGPAVETLDRCWGARWRPGSEDMFYSRRRKVIKEIRRRVEDGRPRDERQAIDQLEQLRGVHSLDWLCKNI
jgi:hypothetical protein